MAFAVKTDIENNIYVTGASGFIYSGADFYTIKYDEELNMWVMYINTMPLMKSKTASAVAKKLWKWLDSQNK